MNKDNYFSELYAAMNAHQLIISLVEVRQWYESIVDIASNESYTESQRKEAEELTKDGFYTFVKRIREMSGQ